MSTLTVAAIQTPLSWLNKEANLAHLSNKIADIAQSVDLILLPETFATGFAINEACAEPKNGPVLDWMIMTAKLTCAVIAGSVLVEQGDKKANRFYWVWPDGEVKYYDKRHLFCLGNEGDFVKAGDQRQVFTIKDFRILPQVCYDLRFPVFQRSVNDYDVMINIANWPAARRKIWDTLLMARAMENQCYVIGVNRVGSDGKGVAHSGGTAIYDFNGDTLAAAKNNEAEVIISTLNMTALEQFKQRFPAHLDADTFSVFFDDDK